MRTIDADALKRDIMSYKTMPEIRKAICEVIDDAPTVEYTFEEAFQKTVCENRLYCPARPKGHWIRRGEFYQCSECSSHELYRENFCHCCGADMRKGGAE